MAEISRAQIKTTKQICSPKSSYLPSAKASAQIQETHSVIHKSIQRGKKEYLWFYWGFKGSVQKTLPVKSVEPPYNKNCVLMANMRKYRIERLE